MCIFVNNKTDIKYYNYISIAEINVKKQACLPFYLSKVSEISVVYPRLVLGFHHLHTDLLSHLCLPSPYVIYVFLLHLQIITIHIYLLNIKKNKNEAQ